MRRVSTDEVATNGSAGRRERILTAAAEIFRTQGYDAYTELKSIIIETNPGASAPLFRR